MTNFWENVVRYPKFFISSLIGLIIIVISPLKKLNKNISGRIIFILLTLIALSTTIKIFSLMLNLED